MTARLTITDSQIEFLIRDKIALFMVLENPFTAFSVTKAIRLDNSRVHIDHDRVRNIMLRLLPGERDGFIGLYEVSPSTKHWYSVDYRLWEYQPARTIVPIQRPTFHRVSALQLEEKKWAAARPIGISVKWGKVKPFYDEDLPF
jgi:hypothetical protein